MATYDEQIQNGFNIGNQTVLDFCQMDSDSIDEEAALLAMMTSSVTALRSRGWEEELLEEHFYIGLEEGDLLLKEEPGEEICTCGSCEPEATKIH
jgi:hypothetical protein